MASALARCSATAADGPTVVYLANEGVHLYYGLPFVRYEIPLATFAREMLGLLQKRMLGERTPPPPVLISGRIEEIDLPPQEAIETHVLQQAS